MANWPDYVNGLMSSAPGSIKRRFPTFWSDGEGGIDWDAKAGTPVIALADGVIMGAGYFCNATNQFRLTSDAGACDHGVVTTRVTNQDGSQTDLYYQHIILNSSIKPCFNGRASCGGQVVKKGDTIGYISNFNMLEMGINVGNSPNPPPFPHGWPTIWGADPAPGPHVDPEPYLRALISGKNTTGTISGTGVGAGTGLPGIDINGILTTLFQPITDLIASLHFLIDWLSNPLRPIKFVVGIGLIAISLILLTLPQAEQNAKGLMDFVKKNPEVLAA